MEEIEDIKNPFEIIWPLIYLFQSQTIVRSELDWLCRYYTCWCVFTNPNQVYVLQWSVPKITFDNYQFEFLFFRWLVHSLDNCMAKTWWFQHSFRFREDNFYNANCFEENTVLCNVQIGRIRPFTRPIGTQVNPEPRRYSESKRRNQSN